MIHYSVIHYSVLIPGWDSTAAVDRMLAQLCPALDNLLLPYEIICIDDASQPLAKGDPADLLYACPRLRVLRFDRPRGTSAALCAGMAAARGDLIIALEPNLRCAPRYVPHLIARLSQFDLVVAEPERSLGRGLLATLAKFARSWTRRGLGSSEPLFWAARREAIAGLTLARGAFRFIGELVAQRGFRVCRLKLAEGLPPRGVPFRPGPFQRLVAAWFDRRFEPHLARELARSAAEATRRQLIGVARGGVVGARLQPPAAVPLEKESNSA